MTYQIHLSVYEAGLWTRWDLKIFQFAKCHFTFNGLCLAEASDPWHSHFCFSFFSSVWADWSQTGKTQERCKHPIARPSPAAAAERNAAASVCHACARRWSFEGSWVERLSGDRSVSSMTLAHAVWRPDIDAVTTSAPWLVILCHTCNKCCSDCRLIRLSFSAAKKKHRRMIYS